ncbi:tyrosine-type recombinase/integrase [Candidatus Enterococcus ferrettii]|uniref:Tyr recombinase domain-containing protein n=1 Tax=Candidatus Enterococcus ferrettii TaxID=2815324 RepID=A0ABV0EQ66_9ENTE|nr:site-specific integrase [Enterococcus sp. 665A]MBO1341231.1 site-specific integrase [Enterococcus sp. 665A]
MRRGENIYWRKDQRWEGRYPKGKKENGATKYGSVYGKTLAEVREKLYPLKVKYQIILKNQGQVTMSVYEWGHQWLAEAQETIKESTYANYEYKLTHYVLSVLGDCALNELNKASGEKLLESLKRQQLRPATIQAIFRITKQCINAAIRKKLLKENPFTQISLPKLVKNNHQVLTKREQKCLEMAALAEKNGKGLPTLLALHAGLRIGEIAALSWKDIDFDNKVIRVQSTFQRIFGVFDGKKTQLLHSSSKTISSTRAIPMSQTIRRALLQQKTETNSEFVVSRKNQPMEPRLITYHFHKIREKVQLVGTNFHQLRHTFATRCLESQGDIVSVSALMGHSSTQMTLDTYAASMMEQRIQVVKQMEKFITNK